MFCLSVPHLISSANLLKVSCQAGTISKGTTSVGMGHLLFLHKLTKIRRKASERFYRNQFLNKMIQLQHIIPSLSNLC